MKLIAITEKPNATSLNQLVNDYAHSKEPVYVYELIAVINPIEPYDFSAANYTDLTKGNANETHIP